MAELELLRALPIDVAPPSDEARARARGRLLRHIRRSPVRSRRRVLVPATALAGAAAAGVLVTVGFHGEGNAAAAAVLRAAAATARTQPAPTPLAPGRFRYTKSVQAFTVTDPSSGWTALGPKVREVWQGPTAGLLLERSQPPRFLSERDRERWIDAGRPQVNAPRSSNPLPPARPLDLPSDPDLLYAKLRAEASGNSNGVEVEMFTLVGDALRETDASPALRAALYEVAARIPGVRLLGSVTDREGRGGLGVAFDSLAGIRFELIFDRRTSSLLEEDEIALAGNDFGYRAGTATGYATYVSTGVVDRLGARPPR